MKKNLVIIPARCGSKGIKHKNIVDICGRPLIAFTINTALRLKYKKVVQEVIVSTDCEEIVTVAERLGVSVPFLRPNEISDDQSKSIEYIIHSIKYLEDKGEFYDAVVILQPTSPLRTFEDVARAIEMYSDNSNDSLISAYVEEKISDLIIYRKKNDLGIPLNINHNKGYRRQDSAPIYIRNGAIYITSVRYVKETLQIISDFPLIYEMPKDRSLNIDGVEDIDLLKSIVCR